MGVWLNILRFCQIYAYWYGYWENLVPHLLAEAILGGKCYLWAKLQSLVFYLRLTDLISSVAASAILLPETGICLDTQASLGARSLDIHLSSGIWSIRNVVLSLRLSVSSELSSRCSKKKKKKFREQSSWTYHWKVSVFNGVLSIW